MTRKEFIDVLEKNGFVASKGNDKVVFNLETENSHISFVTNEDINSDFVSASMYSKGFYVSYCFHLNDLIIKNDFTIKRNEENNEIKISINSVHNFYIPC